MALFWFCPDKTHHTLLMTGFSLTSAVINSAELIYQRKLYMLRKAKGAKCSSVVVQLQAEPGQITTDGVTGSVRSMEIPGMGSCCAFSDLAVLFVTRRYC